MPGAFQAPLVETILEPSTPQSNEDRESSGAAPASDSDNASQNSIPRQAAAASSTND